MRRQLLIGIVAVLSILGVPAPALAGSGAGAFTFDASPEPVKKGGYVTLSGRNTTLYFSSGVSFYFKADGSSKWVYQNSTTVKNGKYSRRQAQNHSGTWKAVAFCECDSVGAPSRTDRVAVRGVQLPGVVNGCSYGDPYYVDFKPSTIDISCTTYWGYTSVKWQRVTSTSAKATAVAHFNDCEPSCGNGHYRTKKVTLTFSRVRLHHGVPTFTEMTEHPSGYSYGLYPAEF
ncbi:hypothetical protein OWR29_33165 [Actinoplanes sp. Pm04-4]|uniref:Uncharacterized protein n=1 Tax=Paractinoplanes pyxinae TaxID=2997416 RepID=A0ABT4BAN3_9ACTN|nr:hypothetical protein [Actinoplanes pyxinae]MCY1142870.1 hypothetical protein [Actinoplanes pyxinae]